MKVFAVERADGELVLKMWFSKAAFIREHGSWVDHPFLGIATGDERDSYNADKKRQYDSQIPKGYFRVVYTDEQVDVHNMLCDAMEAYYPKQKSSK